MHVQQARFLVRPPAPDLAKLFHAASSAGYMGGTSATRRTTRLWVLRLHTPCGESSRKPSRVIEGDAPTFQDPERGIL